MWCVCVCVCCNHDTVCLLLIIFCRYILGEKTVLFFINIYIFIYDSIILICCFVRKMIIWLLFVLQLILLDFSTAFAHYDFFLRT